MTWGVAINLCRGASVVKLPVPVVRAAISSQRCAPILNGLLPKSSVTLNTPLLTATAELVAGPATKGPPVEPPKIVNVRS